MAPITETILGVFAHVDTTVRALEELRAKGYHDLTVYSPIPEHQIEDVLERDRPVSRVRLFTLCGGLIGIASAFFITIWTSLQWGLVTGGKFLACPAPFSWCMPTEISGSSLPPFFIIGFELMVLFGGVATYLGLIILGGLPKFRPSPTFDPRFTNDRFGVAVHCAAERSPSVREILQRSGAEEVRT